MWLETMLDSRMFSYPNQSNRKLRYRQVTFWTYWIRSARRCLNVIQFSFLNWLTKWPFLSLSQSEKSWLLQIISADSKESVNFTFGSVKNRRTNSVDVYTRIVSFSAPLTNKDLSASLTGSAQGENVRDRLSSSFCHSCSLPFWVTCNKIYFL